MHARQHAHPNWLREPVHGDFARPSAPDWGTGGRLAGRRHWLAQMPVQALQGMRLLLGRRTALKLDSILSRQFG